MAALSITVPDALVPELLVIARAQLTSRGVNFTGWTDTQVGQRWIAFLIRDQLMNTRRAAAELQMTADLNARRVSDQAQVDAVVTQANTDAATITG
jgi:hypothetical protein